MVSKPKLGKGLASLLPSSSPVPPPMTKTNEVSTVSKEEGNADRHPGIALVPIEDILVNPYQPRRSFEESALNELSDSIKANGLIQPLVVRKTATGFQLIAGERRLRASKKAGLKQVPVVIRRSTDRESLEVALVENIQRQDLNCIDEALAYFQLMQDFSLTQEEVAERVGKDRATVANHLRLLRLGEEIIEDLKKGDLTFGHGKALLALDDAEKRLRLRERVLSDHLSVRETEKLVSEFRKEGSGVDASLKKSSKAVADSYLSQISQSLTRLFSTKVELKGNQKKGKIIFHYGSSDELNRVLESIRGG